MQRFKAAGTLVVGTATNVAEAVELEVAGVDAVVAQGDGWCVNQHSCGTLQGGGGTIESDIPSQITCQFHQSYQGDKNS